MKKYDIAIVGGGFSGLCLAAMLDKKYHKSTVIIECGKRVGKKILSTGNGQANITNMSISEQDYHGDAAFASKVLSRYSNKQLIAFFNSLGLFTASIGDKVYPASFCAGAVLDVLRYKLEGDGVEILTECEVLSISKNGDYLIQTNCNKLRSECVILAFGGKSGAGFNTEGKAYHLALELGHKLTELSPSLVPLMCDREQVKGLKGIKAEVVASIYDGKKLLKSTQGDIIFTDYGVSGNAIFYLSAYMRGNSKPRLEICFAPSLDATELKEGLMKKCAMKNMTYERLLGSVVHTKIAQIVIKNLGLNPDEKADSKKAESIVNRLRAYYFDVTRCASFDLSQVTSGGIDTKDVNAFTMESKLQKGLYIIGEALDVDGNCGGYNMQWAFSTAAVCAEALNAKN